MEKLKPYPKYKPVNLPWLKEIPVHWEMLRAKKLFSIFDERSKDGDESLLSVSSNYGVVNRNSIDVTMFKAESYVGYKLCYPQDLVVNSLWAWAYGLGFSEQKGIISTAYSVYRLRNCQNTYYLYYSYLLRSSAYHWEFRIRSKGIWKSRYQLHDSSFMNIPIILPPPDEQKKIVAFLDEKTAKIDKYIEAKHRYFELILEKLVSKIFRKSLSKKIASWSSLFPDKWERKQVKRLFEEVSLKGFPEEELAAVTQDRGVVLKRDCSQNYVSPDGNYEKQKLIRPNDFVISLRSFEGGIEYSSVRGLVSSAYNIFCLREKYNNKEMIEFYRIMFKSKPFISLLNTFTNTIRDGKDISFKDISRVELPIPDKKFLNDFYKRVKIYRITVSNFEKIRKLLIEYKTRLISDAVTGKIKV